MAKIPILCAWRLSLKSALTSMEFGSNWYQIRNKTCYIPKVSKCYVKKGYVCEPVWECHLWHVNVYIKEQSLMQREHPMELYFEGLEMRKWIIPIDRAQRVDVKNGFICLVIVLTPKVMVIKTSQIALFLHLLLMKAKD